MSSKVWKCDFCIKTDTNKKQVDKHEKTCSFNPEHKACYTCKHYPQEWRDIFSCAVNEDYFDYDTDGGCPKHEI